MAIIAGNRFNLVLNVGIDDVNILSSFIDYVGADGSKGSWAATPVVGEQQIEYEVQPGEVGVPGLWKFQSLVITAEGGMHGNPVEIFVNKTIRVSGHAHL